MTDEIDKESPSAERPASGRQAGGRFGLANDFAVTHGGRRSLDRPETLAAIAAKRSELTGHVGGDPSVIEADLIGDYAFVDALIESVKQNIEIGGVFTTKGASRAAVSLLQTLLERRDRLAQRLGIKRRSKRVDLAQAFATQERVRG